MYRFNWSFIIKFVLTFFGLIAWIGISYYVLHQVAAYVAENVFKINLVPGDTMLIWILFNATAFLIALFFDDFY